MDRSAWKRAIDFVLYFAFVAIVGRLLVAAVHHFFPELRRMTSDAIGAIIPYAVIFLVLLIAYYGVRCAIAFWQGMKEAEARRE